MSIQALAKGDVLKVYAETAGDWTENEELIFVKNTEGCVQILSASESRKYGGDGQSRFVQILFASDPGITTAHVLKHASKTDGTILEPRWLRVRSTKEEGPPGRSVLWVVYAEQLTNDGTPEIG